MPFHPGLRGALKKVTRALTDSVADGTDQNTYTFSTRGLGAETPDRFIVVCVVLTGGAVTATLDSVTVGGVSASLVVAASLNGGHKQIWATPKVSGGGPTGTTGTVVVSATSAPVCLNCAIEIYAVKGASSTTAHATASDTSAPLSQSINVPANGIAIAGARGAGTPGNATWTGLTEDVDAGVDAGVVVSTSASAEFQAAQSGLTVAVSFAAGTAADLAVASWGP